MKDYTVVGYHDRTGVVIVEHTQAKDAEMAVAFAVCQLAQHSGKADICTDAVDLISTRNPDLLEFSKTIMILDVFEGLHKGELESCSAFCAFDHPELGG
jgi:hypothetical protein